MLTSVNMVQSSFFLISCLTLMINLKLSLSLLSVIPLSCEMHLLLLNQLLSHFLCLCNGHWWLLYTQGPHPLWLLREASFFCGESSFHPSWLRTPISLSTQEYVDGLGLANHHVMAQETSLIWYFSTQYEPLSITSRTFAGTIKKELCSSYGLC